MTKTEKENIITNYRVKLGISQAEAEALYESDYHDKTDSKAAAVIKEYTEKAKKNGTTIKERKSVTNTKPATQKERKIDSGKASLMDMIQSAIEKSVHITGRKNEVELYFYMDDESTYTLKLTKHRKPKK